MNWPKLKSWLFRRSVFFPAAPKSYIGLLAENKRLDAALRRIALYKGATPAKDFDHCVIIAREALYPEYAHDPDKAG